MNYHHYTVLNQILSNWPAKSKGGAYQIIQKYGYPTEATSSRLIWYKNGPWKHTILYRDPVPHNFPAPHVDFLKQTIDYKVPVHLYDKVAEFDGSVLLDRTKGEASAKCDKEEMNFLALNLLNDIVTGKRSVENARLFYADTVKMFKQGMPSPYTQGLLFPIQKNTADPDVSIIK